MVQEEAVAVKPKLPNGKLIIGEYVLDRTIGRGTFGQVKLGYHIRTGVPVAVKIINKMKAIAKQTLDKARLHREVTVLRLVANHPNIVRLYELKDTPTDLFLFLEFCSRGELFDYICKKRRLSESESRTFFQQLVSAICHCHYQYICHRDLKPENILLNEERMLKIGDFGLSNFNGGGGFLQTYCGSPNYAAPEIVCGKPYVGPEVDIWSCGVILYAMVCGYLPFDDPHLTSLFSKIKAGNITIPGYLTAPLQNLIRRMISVNPCNRITLKEIKTHSWFDISLPHAMKINFEYGPSPPVEITLRRRLMLGRHGLPEFTEDEVEEIKRGIHNLTRHVIKGVEPDLEQAVLEILDPVPEDLDTEILQQLVRLGYNKMNEPLCVDSSLRPDVDPSSTTVTYHLKKDSTPNGTMPLQTAAYLGITHVAIRDSGIDLMTERQKQLYDPVSNELIKREFASDDELLDVTSGRADSLMRQPSTYDMSIEEDDAPTRCCRNIPKLRLHCQDWSLMPIAFPREIQKKAAACQVFRKDLTDQLNTNFSLKDESLVTTAPRMRPKDYDTIFGACGRGYEHEPGFIITTLLNILSDLGYLWEASGYNKYFILIKPSQSYKNTDSKVAEPARGYLTNYRQKMNNGKKNKYDIENVVPQINGSDQYLVVMIQILRSHNNHTINYIHVTGPVFRGLFIVDRIHTCLHRKLSETSVMRPG